MKWFKHDSDASSDAKIKKLIIRHGAVGYAVYFHCLELIAGNVSNQNLTFELEHDSEIIADNLRIVGNGGQSGQDIVEGIMHTIIDLNLFELRGDLVTCPKMIRRLDSSMTGNTTFRKMIQDAKDSHDIRSKSHDSVTKTTDTVMLEKSRSEKKKEKNRKEDLAQSDDSLSVGDEVKDPIFILPQLGGKEFPITQDQVETFSAAYPAVNVPGELHKMKAWLMANKKNQRKDVMRFANSWLSETVSAHLGEQ